MKKISFSGIMYRERKTRKRGNKTMRKKVLNFKLEFSDEEITPYAGLCIYGEMYRAIGLDKEVNRIFPRPGSGAGFKANTYIQPLAMMFLGGGKYIEDIRKIRIDKGLRRVCKIEKVPSADAIGDWMRRNGAKKNECLKIVNDNLTRRVARKAKAEDFTLDIDAMEIEAEKEEAHYTYKGNKGYMPLAGFIPELDWCLGYEFREGNVAPQERNYEFTAEAVELVEESGKKIKRFRSDSAAYQAKLMNYLDPKGIKYTITADQDVSVKESIRTIKEESWKRLKDRDGIDTGREYAQTIHSMGKTDHAFRLIAQRWPNPQRDLFEKTQEYYYQVIATNYLEEEKSEEEVIWWHNGRCNSENYNKEIKIGFNLDYLPCGELEANAVWFGIGVLAYNLFIASKIFLFPKEWLKKTISTVRWQFIQIAGKIIKRSRQVIVRICSTLREIFEIYEKAREICWELQYIL